MKVSGGDDSRILVADDDPLMRRLFGGLLTRAGYEVEIVTDGQALWEAFTRRPTRVIVSDWQMPRMTGVEACRLVRGVSGRAVRFIVVTSLSVEAHWSEAEAAGVDVLLKKPVDRERLLSEIRVSEGACPPGLAPAGALGVG